MSGFIFRVKPASQLFYLLFPLAAIFTARADETPVVTLEKVAVSAKQETLTNTIDRKIYTVGQDVQSATGAASDLLQNIPSVQVDIDGNVSLRGSDSVLILIDGKSSTLMGKDRATALAEMPADAIERIEVITNPSAKYKPDGTAGIINIVRKRKGAAGYSGVASVNVGTDDRYNFNLSGNARKNGTNVSASYSLRRDDRPRVSTDDRSHLDPVTDQVVSTQQRTVENSRPLSQIVQLGVDQAIGKNDKVEATLAYNQRTFTRTGTDDSTSEESGTVTGQYQRARLDPEYLHDMEFRANGRHDFAESGHELSLDFKRSRSDELEDNRYTTVYMAPVTPVAYDTTRIKTIETGTETALEYVRPLANDAKLEAGYAREDDRSDMDHLGTFLDPATGLWVRDITVSNRFIYDGTLDSLYATYSRSWGKFGTLVGFRFERMAIDTDQVTAGLNNTQDYTRFYPSLHLSYNLSETSQLQLNYSHRVRRPDSEDFNPYPEYQDPYNLRAGNPALRPEDTHSFEAGYQYRNEETTYLATVYYRYRYNSITEVTRFIDAVTLLTTKENLSSNQSGGLELAANRDLGRQLSVRASANAYYSEIDASNLGFSATRSTVTWEGKLSLNYRLAKSTLLQFNTNYTAKRLTPQGYRLPTFVANLGLRHELVPKKLAFIATVSDLFDSLKERTVIDTPALQRATSRRRSARVIFIGLSYNFGTAGKKTKDETMQFDDKL